VWSGHHPPSRMYHCSDLSKNRDQQGSKHGTTKSSRVHHPCEASICRGSGLRYRRVRRKLEAQLWHRKVSYLSTEAQMRRVREKIKDKRTKMTLTEKSELSRRLACSGLTFTIVAFKRPVKFPLNTAAKRSAYSGHLAILYIA
jgi:hypothetical protein